MMPGPDDGDDRLIGEIARQLRHPVALDERLAGRVMAELDRPRPVSRRLAWGGMAVAAGLALLAFFLARPAHRASTGEAVSFSIDAPDASRVSLVGDFNDWDPSATPLARSADGTRWEAVLPLSPGRYQFTFVVDGSRWVRDPLLPQATGDDFGQPTSVITIVSPGRS
jgi:hypothetical protein